MYVYWHILTRKLHVHAAERAGQHIAWLGRQYPGEVLCIYICLIRIVYNICITEFIFAYLQMHHFASEQMFFRSCSGILSRPSSGPIAPHTSAHAHALCLFFNRILVVFCFAFDFVFFVFCIFHLYNVHIYEYFCFIFHIVHFSFMFFLLFHCFCYLFYLPRHPGVERIRVRITYQAT